MISRQAQQSAILTLLLFCSTQYSTVDSAKIHENDFYAKPNPSNPFITSKITSKPIYATPYYVPTGVEALHKMNFKGKGVKLGIIDSGINLKATAFKGKHEYHRIFVAAKYGQGKDTSGCNKRGVSLAGIAVAKTDYFTGVAPEATLGTYRVFGCRGPTSTSLVLKAITAAINDQMKIIVLPEIAIVDESSAQLRLTIEDAANQGVIMIVAATVNNFINRQYFSYKRLYVLSVGGAKQEYHLSHWFEERTTGRRIEFTSSCLNMKYNFGKEVDIIPNNPIDPSNEYSNGFEERGIALVWYKKIEMQALIELARVTGMAALIIVNDVSRERNECNIPLFNISEKDALFIEEGYKNKRGHKYIFAEKYGYIEDGNVTIDSAGPQNQLFIPPLYPDILAPSYKIYTTTITTKMNEPHFSDISAAVAYVAGAVALMTEVNPKSSLDVVYVKTLLQNSAVPIKDSNPNYYAPVSYQGAGMINLDKLIDVANIFVAPSSINMGYTYANTVNIPIKISSLSSTLLSYKLSHIPTAAVSKVSYFIDMSLRPPVIAAVSFPKSISLLPNQISEIIVAISPPTNILKNEIWSYSGYIVIDPNPEVNRSTPSRAVYVPYQGIVKS